jgi:phosphoglycerol transferase MdoB-like AlkP superfamily enzyme
MNWTILVLSLLLIIPEAIYEGLKNRGKHIPSEIIEFLLLTIIVLVAFAWTSGIPYPFDINPAPFWKLVAGYCILRFGIFDIFRNIAAGKPISYIGDTKAFDKLLAWIIEKGKIHISLVWFARLISTAIALAWLLNYKQ